MGTKKGTVRADHQINTNPGENTKYIYHNLEVSALPPIDTNDATALAERFAEYFNICAKNDMKPNVAGLSLCLGIDRKTLFDYENGRIHKPQEVVHTIKRAKSLVNGMMEDYMQNGKINPVAGIFLMKNNMNYTDTQEHIVVPQNSLTAETPEQLIDGVKNLPD